MRRLILMASAAALLAIPATGQEMGTAAANFFDSEGVATGSVSLSQGEGGVIITGNLTGIPAGDHGFHFHETGIVTPPPPSSRPAAVVIRNPTPSAGQDRVRA